MNAKAKAGGVEEDEALTADLSAVRAQIARLADRLAGEDGAALDRARGIADDLTQEWRRIEGEIAGATRRNPWRGLAAAAFVGFVLGLILRR